MFFFKKISIRPHQVGFLYWNNQLEQKLEPGRYSFFDLRKEYNAVIIPTTNFLAEIWNQEVLTSDHIALRFSFIVEYQITEPEVFIEKFDVSEYGKGAQGTANQLVHNYSQVHIRKLIGKISSEELNEKRNELLNEVPESLKEKMASYGITIHQEMLKDITFPKPIQQLFARQLEAKIRARTDLENARSTVASARALKNASEIMKGDENIKYFQLLETMTKIASKGNHTFVLSDFLKK